MDSKQQINYNNDGSNNNKKYTTSKIRLISEDDVNYLIQRFPSMNGRFKMLLKGLLSSYQNEQGNNGDYQNKNDVIGDEDEEENDDDEEENDYRHNDKNNNNEELESFDGFDNGDDDYSYFGHKLSSLSPWFKIMQEEGRKGEFLIEAMIDKDGKAFLMKHIFGEDEGVDDYDVEFGILNMAIYCSSLNLVNIILDVGGEDLVSKQKNALQKLLLNYGGIDPESTEMPEFRETIKKLIVLGNYSTLYEFDNDQPAIVRLFEYFDEETVEFVASVIIGGGKDAVMRQENYYGRSLMHFLSWRDDFSIETTKDLLRVGGKDLVLLKDNDGRTALSSWVASDGMIDQLLKTGGKDLVKSQDNDGNTFLHILKNDLETCLKVLQIGGKELLMQKNCMGKTALHCFCNHKEHNQKYLNEEKRIEVIKNFIRFGGKELVRMKDTYEATALHYECSRSKSSLDVVKKLLEVSVTELGIQAKAYPLYQYENPDINEYHLDYEKIEEANKAISNEFLNPVQCSVILYQSHNQCVKARSFGDNIDEEENEEDGNEYEDEEIDSDEGEEDDDDEADDQNDDDVETENTSVLLYVLAKGIELNIGTKYSIGGLFEPNTISSVHQKIFERWFGVVLPALKQQSDLMARQPLLEAAIIVAAPSNILISIIEHFHYHRESSGTKKRRLAINIAADFGLKWSKGMKDIAEVEYMRNSSIGSEKDEKSGFYPFMLAAKGNDSDLDAVFGLARRSPEVVRKLC